MMVCLISVPVQLPYYCSTTVFGGMVQDDDDHVFL